MRIFTIRVKVFPFLLSYTNFSLHKSEIHPNYICQVRFGICEHYSHESCFSLGKSGCNWPVGPFKVVLDCITLFQNNSKCGNTQRISLNARVLPDLMTCQSHSFPKPKGLRVFKTGRVAGVWCGTAREERKDKMEIMFAVEMTGSQRGVERALSCQDRKGRWKPQH